MLNWSGTKPVIQLWWVSFAALAEVEPVLGQWLTTAETSRAAQFRCATERSRFVLTRAALRNLLSRTCGQPQESLVFEQNEAGKPKLVGQSLEFNVTHSGDWAALALTHAGNGPIGIDLEQCLPLPNFTELLAVTCTSHERAQLLALPAATRETAFYQSWCRKEAWLKAQGCGLQIAPNKFAIPAEPWAVTDLTAPAGYAAALATRLKNPQIIEQNWEFPFGQEQIQEWWRDKAAA